uniref:Uncharacterized protein n=1 Tax=Piliocolobus tephrosceles TaxID=591936 RepID=A0A8C9ID62_9PRIM
MPKSWQTVHRELCDTEWGRPWPRLCHFDRVLEKISLVSAILGKVMCEMKADQYISKIGTFHRGLTTTLVDNVITMWLTLCSREYPDSVSIECPCHYKNSRHSDYSTQHRKQGKALTVASVEGTNKAVGKCIAQGRCTNPWETERAAG